MTAVLFCPYCGAKFATPQTQCTECGKVFGGQARTMLGMSAKEILEQARKERGDRTPAPSSVREGTPAGGTLQPEASAAGSTAGATAGAGAAAALPAAPARAAALAGSGAGIPDPSMASTMAADGGRGGVRAETAPAGPRATGTGPAAPRATGAATAAPRATGAGPAAPRATGAMTAAPRATGAGPAAGPSSAPASAPAAAPAEPRAATPAPAPAAARPRPAAAPASEDAELEALVRSGGGGPAKYIALALIAIAVLGGAAFAAYTLFFAEPEFIVSHDVKRVVKGADEGHAGSAFVVELSVDGARRPFTVALGDASEKVKGGKAKVTVPWETLKVGANKLEAKIHGDGKSMDYEVDLVRPFSIEANGDKAAETGKVSVALAVAKGFKAKVAGKDVAVDKKKLTDTVEVELGDALETSKDGEAVAKIEYVVSGEGKSDKYEGSLTVKLALPETPAEVLNLKAGEKIPSVKRDVYTVRIKAPAEAEVLVNGKKAKKDPKEDVFEADVKLVKGGNDITVSASAPRHRSAALKLSVTYEG
jgi:hypothetical protein